MGLYFIADPDGYWIEILPLKSGEAAVRPLLARRSVRQFSSDRVPEELLMTLLRSAMQAPSAGNQQPWQFILVRDREKLVKIPSFQQ